MNNLKIIGTRGKKRKKVAKLLTVLGVAVSVFCLLVFYFPFENDSGVLIAGVSHGPPGTQTREEPDTIETVASAQNGSKELGKDPDLSENTEVAEDEREIAFGPIGIGPNIKAGDFIDIRLMYQDGTDYIVVSKKELLDYNASTGMTVIKVRESELLTLNSAMADRNSIQGITLYAVRYVNPLVQEAADISYRPNEAVSGQIRGRNDVIGR